MVGPSLFAAVDYLLSMPFFAKYLPKPSPKTCLTSFYGKYNKEKLPEIDNLLKKYKGREHKLYENLERQYGVPTGCT